MEQGLEVTAAAIPTIVTPSPDVADKLGRKPVDAGSVRLTDDQQAQLLVMATLDQIELKPTGEIYVPGVQYRQVLQTVFGPGGWRAKHGKAVLDVPVTGNPRDENKSTLYTTVELIVGRCTRCYRTIKACGCGGPYDDVAIAEDVGAQAYSPKNARMTYDDALSGAVTNGLMRCTSKTLGAFSNCWDPRWAEQARARIGVRVRVLEWNDREMVRWRRFDRLPLDGEQGLAPGSPNADRYTGAKPKLEPVIDIQRPAPPVVKASPPAAAAPVKAATTGEQIGVIRAVDGGWVVQTNAKDPRFTDDRALATRLEQLKLQGKRVVFELERQVDSKNRVRYFILDTQVV